MKTKTVEWPTEDESAETDEKTSAESLNLAHLIAKKNVHLLINLPIRGSGAYRVSNVRTLGYRLCFHFLFEYLC